MQEKIDLQNTKANIEEERKKLIIERNNELEMQRVMSNVKPLTSEDLKEIELDNYQE